jgi:hypothetical protein
LVGILRQKSLGRASVDLWRREGTTGETERQRERKTQERL